MQAALAPSCGRGTRQAQRGRTVSAQFDSGACCSCYVPRCAGHPPQVRSPKSCSPPHLGVHHVQQRVAAQALRRVGHHRGGGELEELGDEAAGVGGGVDEGQGVGASEKGRLPVPALCSGSQARQRMPPLQQQRHRKRTQQVCQSVGSRHGRHGQPQQAQRGSAPAHQRAVHHPLQASTLSTLS